MTNGTAGFPASTGTPVAMGSTCAGSVRCYAAMLRSQLVITDSAETRLPLRHSHHRYSIVGPNGVQQLTVPLVGSTNAMQVPLDQVRISEHGEWRQRHWGAIFSAYGKTPYFDFIAPELKDVILGQQQSLLEFNEQMQALILDFLDLPILTTVRPIGNTPPAAGTCDLRGRIAGKKPDRLPITDVAYHQQWADRLGGFQTGLSVLDMLMNVGREAVFYLCDMTKTSTTELKDINALHF